MSIRPVKKTVISLAMPLLLLCACNKDEEIIIDNPGDDTGQTGETTDNDYFTVIEYLPAPGQYINDPAAGFTDVITPEEACGYAQKRLSKNSYVSLGGFGGYITVRAKESIRNSGGYDFSIAGNSFDTSNEPGIVWVMQDSNRNGKPDDQWYQLRGSYYGEEGFEEDYSVTYYHPDGAGADIRWTDSNGDSGYIRYLASYHKQDSYYPEWITADSYTLSGSRLPSRTTRNPTTGDWTSAPFKWGYADNAGEDSEMVEINGRMLQMNHFRISDAVMADGQPANLEYIDFIKVQTAVNVDSGWLGELSTDILGFFLK